MTPARNGRFFLLCSLLLLLISGAAPLPGAAAEPLQGSGYRPMINGSFIQLLEENGSWSRARWERLFDCFQTLGLSQIVVQWSLHDDRAFYPGRSSGPGPAALDTILQLAQARGIEVYLGLAAESRYWEMIKRSPAGQEEYLNRLRWKSERVAREVAATAARYRVFKGWYIPEEIDDLTWRPPKSRQLLTRQLRELSGFLKKLTPGGLVMLSAFSGARMDPDSYQEFWRDLLRETSVDILLFQDGAGTGQLPRELLPLYLQAARNAADANHKKLQVVVELFELVSETPFKAVPAPIQRVTGQLQLAGEYASGGINSFSVPDYMALEESAAARALLEGYLAYRGRAAGTAPAVGEPALRPQR